MQLDAITIKCTLKSNVLSAEILSEKCLNSDSAKYALYLIRDRKIVERVDYSTENCTQWILEQEGVYQVQGFLSLEGTKYSSYSDNILYKKCIVNLYGPKELYMAAADACLLHDSSANTGFTLIDCAEIVRQMWPLTKNKQDGRPLVRAAVEEILKNCHGLTYWVFWELRACPALKSMFYWLLEECYDVCRTDREHDIRELRVAVEISADPNTPEEFISCFYSGCELANALTELKIQFLCRDFDKALPRLYITEDQQLNLEPNLIQLYPGDLFAAYLYKDGSVIRKNDYSPNADFSWPLAGSGVYYAALYLKRYNRTFRKTTLSVFYSDEELRASYEQFIQNSVPEAPFRSDLPFFPEQPPFADFLVIKGAVEKRVDSFNGLPLRESVRKDDGEINIYSNLHNIIRADGKTVYFSGKILYKHKYRYGAEELTELPEPLGGQLGQYSYMEVSEDGIIFGNDFYCFNQWFYYDKDGLTVVSNNYHLLLLALRHYGAPLRLCRDKAIVTLASKNFQFLHQNFSRHMDVEDCEQVPFDKILLMTRGELAFEQSKIGKILSSRKPYHEAEYIEQIKRAADDLLTNFNGIIHDERYKEITVDLTGGLDSRFVYAMLTSSTDASSDRIKINTKDIPGSKDLTTAMGLNNLYGYPLNDFPEKLEYLPVVQADEYNRHAYLGLYYSKNLLFVQRKQKGRMEMNGACGEISFRPYVSRRVMGTKLRNIKNPQAFAEAYFEWNAYMCILDGETVRDSFNKLVGEEFLLVPGDTYLEKLDRHYLGFRHAYHFNSISERMGYDRLMPLQSKDMLALHHYCYDAHRSIRLQIDMISQMNPYLMMVPFDMDADNEDAKPFLYRGARNLHVQINYDTTNWQKAEAVRKSRCSITIPKGHEKDYRELPDMIKRGLMRHFHILMNLEPELKNSIGPALYYEFSILGNNRAAVTYWYNKITSLMDQSLITHGSRESESLKVSD